MKIAFKSTTINEIERDSFSNQKLLFPNDKHTQKTISPKIYSFPWDKEIERTLALTLSTARLVPRMEFTQFYVFYDSYPNVFLAPNIQIEFRLIWRRYFKQC